VKSKVVMQCQCVVVKEGGQPQDHTEFGAGSGSGSESRVFPYHDQPSSTRVIFSIFFIFLRHGNIFHFHVNIYNF